MATTGTTRTARVEARIVPDALAVVRRAAELQGGSVSDFLVAAALRDAQRTIEDAQIIRLSVEDQQRFAELLIDSPPTAPAMILDKDGDDGHDDPLNLVVEIKSFRVEDAVVKAETMTTQWVPGVNALGSLGRWAFAEFRSAHDLETDFDKLIQGFVAANRVPESVEAS
jgi:uncharacterized protein (DUF1778 family)